MRLYGDLSALFSKIFNIHELTSPKRRLDLVFLQEAPIVFQYKVITEGKILYESSFDFRTDYEDRVLRKYLDFEFVNNLYLKEAALGFAA